MDNSSFPQSIIVRDDVRAELKTLTAMYNKAVKAYRCLIETPDYEVPDNLAEINVQRLADFVQGKIKAVEASLILTSGQAEEIKKGWLIFERNTKGYIKELRQLLDNYPEAEYLTNTGELTCKDTLQSIAEKRCTKVVPPEAKTHYNLLRDVFARFEVLRQWEEKQDCKKIPFARLSQMLPEELAEAWATGSIKIDHKFDHLPTVIGAQGMKELYL